MKADIVAVRPPNEEYGDSIKAIWRELRTAGIDRGSVTNIREGGTQPDGSTLFNIFLSKVQSPVQRTIKEVS